MKTQHTGSNIKIPFGLSTIDGSAIEVSQVSSGRQSHVVCPSCKGYLQANKGKINRHYFSHDPSNISEIECDSAFESAIHLMSKQILAEHKTAIFPHLRLSETMVDDNNISHSDSIDVARKAGYVFRDVVLEKKLGDIRPDIIAYTDTNLPVLIEIAVTSFSGAEKKAIFAHPLEKVKISNS